MRNRTKYKLSNRVTVNIWTSDENSAVRGSDSMGHISLETNSFYISFWPRDSNKIITTKTLSFIDKLREDLGSRRPAFKVNYEQDVVGEGDKRIIKLSDELKADEKLYMRDRVRKIYFELDEKPESIDPNTEILYAVKPCPANVRINLYGLNTDELLYQFKNLHNTPGWQVIGSNVLTRLGDTTTAENCSSLAYRCLRAAGMYEHLNGSLSSENSLITSPDLLLRHVVAAKKRELKEMPETQFWLVQSVNETSISDLKIAYENADEEIDCEKKPSVKCNVM